MFIVAAELGLVVSMMLVLISFGRMVFIVILVVLIFLVVDFIRLSIVCLVVL